MWNCSIEVSSCAALLRYRTMLMNEASLCLCRLGFTGLSLLFSSVELGWADVDYSVDTNDSDSLKDLKDPSLFYLFKGKMTDTDKLRPQTFILRTTFILTTGGRAFSSLPTALGQLWKGSQISWAPRAFWWRDDMQSLREYITFHVLLRLFRVIQHFMWLLWVWLTSDEDWSKRDRVNMIQYIIQLRAHWLEGWFTFPKDGLLVYIRCLWRFSGSCSCILSDRDRQWMICQPDLAKQQAANVSLKCTGPMTYITDFQNCVNPCKSLFVVWSETVLLANITHFT